MRARARSPAAASARFSSTSGTTSAIVARATRSSVRSTAGWSSPSSARASVWTTPVPQRSAHGYADGLVATMGQSGRRLTRPVVVGDDHVEPELARAGDLVDRGDPAVDGEHEVDAVRGELLDRLAGEAVALVEPTREAPFDVGAELTEDEEGDRGRRDAVDVVVAVDADSLACSDRPADPCDGDVHVAERRGIVVRRLCGEECAGRGRIVEPAPDQHRRGRLADLERVGERLDTAPVTGSGRPPAFQHRPADGTEPAGRCCIAKRESAEADSRRLIPGRWPGQIPEGARCRGRNYCQPRGYLRGAAWHPLTPVDATRAAPGARAGPAGSP